MKKTIKIAVNQTIVNRIEKEIDLPETAKYFLKNDDGNFFPRGIILFAIIPKYDGIAGKYILLEVEANKQDFNDFIPSEDCGSEFWIKDGSIRHTALDLLMGKEYQFNEITKEEFDTKRMELLNSYQSWISK